MKLFEKILEFFFHQNSKSILTNNQTYFSFSKFFFADNQSIKTFVTQSQSVTRDKSKIFRVFKTIEFKV
jgi:hypothetical protein